MSNPSIDPRSSEQRESALADLAERLGQPLKVVREVERRLREIPIEEFLEGVFGPEHQAFYDPTDDLWIVPDRRHTGPGFGFIAIRSDRSFFTGVVPLEIRH